jgi:hypothetical protein
MLSTHLTFEEIGARLSVSLEPFPGLRLTARPTRD